MEQFRENASDSIELEVELTSPGQPDSPPERNPDKQGYISRQFDFQPVVGPNRQVFGIEMAFRAGWDERKRAAATSRIMLDNCLLHGFDGLTRGGVLFLPCTRETLLSGFLSLLPRSTVFQVPESVEPEDDVVRACQDLKDAGYRFALDDFEYIDAMEEFLHIADFLKIDFRNLTRRLRGGLLRRLHLTDAVLIAAHVDSPDDFRQAADEGFGLFQGMCCGESVAYAIRSDSLNPVNCMEILEALDWPDLSTQDLAHLISLEPGIERRILSKARWTLRHGAAILHALAVVPRGDVRKIVNLAIEAASEQCVNQALAPEQHPRDNRGDDVLIRWYEMGAKTPWWWNDGNDSGVH